MYFKLKTYLKQQLYGKPIIWPALEMLQGVKYALNYFYYYKLLKGKKGLSIREINLEFASQCNLRCQFCSLDHLKPKQLIEPETLETFLKGFVTDKRYQKIKRINLYNGGEVLLHPKRIALLELIKKYKDSALEKGYKFPEIHLLTNGMLLREKLAEDIIKVGIVDNLGVSFDGGTPEVYEEMRTNAKWPKFYENIKIFNQLRKKHNSSIKMTAISCIPSDKPRNTKWMHPEFQEVYNMLDYYELRRLHNWAGKIDEIKIPEKKHKIGCTLMMEQMVLLPNGDVTICCNDLNSEAVIGNILKTDFISVYSSKIRMNYLYLMLTGRKNEIEFCRGCETF